MARHEAEGTNASPAELAFSRRTFLHAGAAGLAMTAASYGRVLGANDRVGVGFVGYGLIGKRHVLDFQAQADVDCVALCDAHSGRLEEGRTQLGALPVHTPIFASCSMIAMSMPSSFPLPTTGTR